MNVIKTICPVPKDQRPINEYLALKSSFGFSWTTSDKTTYYKMSLKIYLTSLVLFFLILTSGQNFSIQILVYSLCSVSLIMFLFYLRLYLAWNYVYIRLMQATVAYEESGWYDGQVWVKSPEILIQDKLAGEYQVKPIIDKIKVTLFAFLLIEIFSLYFAFFETK